MITPPPPSSLMHLVVLTGMSGSGKSVALTALEDVGFYCVDNLPPELLLDFIALKQSHQSDRVAVAMDVRSAQQLHVLPDVLKAWRKQHTMRWDVVFLETTTETLVKRFSETRRRHPLSQQRDWQASSQFNEHQALIESIELERETLHVLRDHAVVLDTSTLRASELRHEIKTLLADNQGHLSLVFESFAFKRGIPMDADFVFDVRMLPNPHYEPTMRHQTGLDADVAQFLAQHPDVKQMQNDIINFLQQWLPSLLHDHRSYVTVGIGCTGGQHRSVYLANQLGQWFSKEWPCRVRHRERGWWHPSVL